MPKSLRAEPTTLTAAQPGAMPTVCVTLRPPTYTDGLLRIDDERVNLDGVCVGCLGKQWISVNGAPPRRCTMCRDAAEPAG